MYHIFKGIWKRITLYVYLIEIVIGYIIDKDKALSVLLSNNYYRLMIFNEFVQIGGIKTNNKKLSYLTLPDV